jgi:nitroreductase
MSTVPVIDRVTAGPARLARKAYWIARWHLVTRPGLAIESWSRKLRGRLLWLAANRGRLAALYYCLFDRSFDREFRSVLQGKLAHEALQTVHCGAPANFRLRRNVHRLEKGLIMRPHRVPFGLDYINETIDSYALLAGEQHGGPPDPLEVWADDVLGRYFEVCAGCQEVDAARSRFRASRRASRAPTEAVPFLPNASPLKTTIEDMEALSLRRRSVRWYQQRPVPRELIDRAIDVARYSPSACNRQPFEFRVFDDPEMVRRIGSIPGGVNGFSHNFPCFVVLVGRLRAYVFEYDRHVIYIDASLAAMAFLFALEVQGISSCCINWADRADKEAQMGRLLGLSPDERVIMCISLGYADPEGLIPFSQKKSVEQIRSYNRAPGVVEKASAEKPVHQG